MITENYSLSQLNTFQFPCTARFFATASSLTDLEDIFASDERQHADKKLILGGGSNMLFTDEQFDGFVLKNEIEGIELLEETDRTVTLRVGGGENRDAFVTWMLTKGYCGIENLISIPGTVGAAPLQNIGAYGVEVESVITHVEATDLTIGERLVFSHDECAFDYRDSLFKRCDQRYLITHVVFKLLKYSPATYHPDLSYAGVQQHIDSQGVSIADITPQTVATAIAAIRASKLPDRKTLGTAGSFFKNPVVSTEQYESLKQDFPDLVGRPVATPHRHSGSLDGLGTKGAVSSKSYPESSDKHTSVIVDVDPQSRKKKNLDISEKSRNPESSSGGQIKLSAGQLIDKAGCKGMRNGPVGTYEKHALVLVHHGGGTGKDLVDLAHQITQKVERMFGVRLEPEVRRV